MSVVSLARTAGVTGLWSNSRSWIVKHLAGAGAHQHDVHLPWATISRISWRYSVERAEPRLAGVMFRAAARRGKPEGHVGVLGVGQDEIAAGGSARMRASFTIERFFHECGGSA